MNYDYRVASNPPQNKTAYEIYEKISETIGVSSVVLREKGDGHKVDEFYANWLEFMHLRTHWWDNNIRDALIDGQHGQITQIIYPLLLNEWQPFLAKYWDYYLLIAQVLQKPQEELLDVPQHNLYVKPVTYMRLQYNCVRECSIKFKGTPEQISDLNKGMTMFGEIVQLKHPLQQYNNSAVEQTHIINGELVSFGYLNQRYHQFWNLEQVNKHYSSFISVNNIQLQLDSNQANVYFDLIIGEHRRIHCRVNFRCPASVLAGKLVEGNLCYSDGGVQVDRQGEYLHFYLRFNEMPQCYINEALVQDEYHEPNNRQWWRCQNFIVNDLMDMANRGLTRIGQALKFSVHQRQTLNAGFLQFCKMLEHKGYLYAYQPQVICRRFSDVAIQQCNYKVSYMWMLLSAMFGNVKLVLSSFMIDKFVDHFKQHHQGHISRAINSLLKLKIQRNTKDTFSQNDFHRIIEQLAKTNPFNMDGIMMGIITPSLIIPEYSIDEYFPGLDVDVVQIKGKQKWRVADEIIKLRMRDDNGNYIQNNVLYVHSKLQNKILISSYFRNLLKKEIKIGDKQYEFMGFSNKSLKHHECYFMTTHFAFLFKQYMFSQLGHVYTKKDTTVKCKQFQQILNELFGTVEGIVQTKDLPPHQLITKKSKHKYTKYSSKVLMPQGKITRDIMQALLKQALDSDTQYSCVLIRYKNKQGILTLKKKPGRSGMIVLTEQMIQKYSSIGYMQDEEMGRRIDGDFISEIQVVAVPKYKQCKLEPHHILNINQFKLNIDHYHINLQVYKQVGEKLHIPKGAYLMAVYDNTLLCPDEVFIQIDDGTQTYIVEEDDVLLFKKNYLATDGLQVFHICSNIEQRTELSKYYKNVIVFSSYMSASRFPFDQFDNQQGFMAIWDRNIIPLIEWQPIDCETDYQQLRYSTKMQPKKEYSQIQSVHSLTSSFMHHSSIENYEFRSWLNQLYNQMIDYYVLFQSSQNFNQLKQLYCNLMLIVITKQCIDQSKVTNAFETLKLANYKYIWYADTQASLQIYPKDARDLLMQADKLKYDLSTMLRLIK